MLIDYDKSNDLSVHLLSIFIFFHTNYALYVRLLKILKLKLNVFSIIFSIFHQVGYPAGLTRVEAFLDWICQETGVGCAF